MLNNHLIYFSIVFVYVAGIIGYSLFLSKNESRADFVIGNRSFGAVRVSFSIVTGWFSAGGLMYYYTLVATDLPTMLILTGAAAISLLIFSCFAPAFYKRAVEKHYITMSEYVTGDIGKITGSICAIILPLLFLCYFLFELIASGFLLSQLTGFSYLLCLFLSAGVVGLYLMLGGFKVLINSDFIQATLLIFFFILLVIIFLDKPEINFSDFIVDKHGLSLKGAVGAFMAFFLAALIAPDTWQRALCAKSGSASRNGLRLASFLYVIVYGGLALLLMGLFSIKPDLMDGQGYSYLIFDYAHPILGALLLTALVAAMMSTLDTIIFIISQSLSTDIAFLFGKRVKNPRFLLRITILISVSGAIILAYFIRDIGALFWFMLSYWVVLTPCGYLFFPSYKPSDKACAVTMILAILGISGLHVTGIYEEYQAAYFFLAALLLPKLFDRVGV